MKNYENVSRNYLTKKILVIIRIDGKGFSKFTKWFKKPYYKVLSYCMQKTMERLCKEISNCKLGFI